MTKINNSSRPLLSITIPTYNRAKYLDLCLTKICKQSKDAQDIIEIVISDNCSTDNTEEVVYKYKNLGNNILYTKNNKNLGIDGNIEKCFSLAKGKYVWIFSDDDILLDGIFNKIIQLLQNGEYGNVYLSNFWYSQDYVKEMPVQKSLFDFTIYKNQEDYLKKVNYWVTFCSGNITNKDIIPKDFNSKKYLGTELTLVHWILTASILSKENVYVNTVSLACKGGNSSGNYKFFTVFGTYLRSICFDVFKEYHISNSVIKYTDNRLLLHFFPNFIISYKRKRLEVFIEEDPKLVFYKEYKNNLIFWLLNYPLFYLPKKIDTLYLRIVKKIIQPLLNFL